MRRDLPFLLTTGVLATGVLLAAGATSAQAAVPRSSSPTPPTAVAAAGTSTSVTLSWSAPIGGPKVAAYTIVLTPGRGHSPLALKVVRPSVRSVTYDRLTAGRSYTLRISATGPRGISVPVAVKYVAQDPAPALAPRTLFAVDSTGTLVKASAAGGATTPVHAGTVSYDVDSAGDAFVLTDSSVVEVTAAGRATTLLDGVTGASELQIDSRGDVFLLEGSSIVELPAGASALKTVVSSAERIAGWTAAADGTVSVLEGDSWAESLTVVTVAPGQAATSRSVDGDFVGTAFAGQFDAKGDLYYSDATSGASGARTAKRVAAGAGTATTIGGGNFVRGLGLTDSDYLLQSATWCPVPSLNSGSCVPDLTVSSIQITSDTGVTTRVPVTGLTTGRAKYTSGAATAVTADSAGTIYVTENAGVFTYAATGGDPTAVLKGSYTDVQLNR